MSRTIQVCHSFPTLTSSFSSSESSPWGVGTGQEAEQDIVERFDLQRSLQNVQILIKSLLQPELVYLYREDLGPAMT